MVGGCREGLGRVYGRWQRSQGRGGGRLRGTSGIPEGVQSRALSTDTPVKALTTDWEHCWDELHYTLTRCGCHSRVRHSPSTLTVVLLACFRPGGHDPHSLLLEGRHCTSFRRRWRLSGATTARVPLQEPLLCDGNAAGRGRRGHGMSEVTAAGG